ncbi:hypothetical protein LUZ61_004326 [Rhynchospora tenuis]|uniref:Succinate dehydrogenase subunit 7, mitochondrial n=1 Tax=Rhynchospora tenuis TaxID=198213 RepID=A0AAD5ZMF5_9POAL|nr:hypothetical protein LUZ61_004326 [Rhynchospora tenuis]
MAAPLSKSPLFNAFRSSSSSQKTAERPLPNNIPRRNYHIELGAREKALLEEDPALKKFRSYKNSVKAASKIGNVLTVVAFAACGYQLVVRAMT